MGDAVHHYDCSLVWDGSTAEGWKAYSRDHRIVTGPADVPLDLTADPAFLGDPSRWNPEQLVVAAASSCQLLSFLAVAARARLDVVSYRDDVRAVMPEDDPPIRITRIDLRPTVVLAGPVDGRPDDDRLRHLTDVAHRQCFIARSLRSDVVVTPTFSWREPAG